METFLLLLNLIILGMAGGCLSGLLGMGGGIIMLPLLITVPQMAGFSIGLRQAVGITMLQSLTGSMSGILVHSRYRSFDPALALAVGGSAAFSSLGGAVFSRMVSEKLIAILFSLMAAASLLLLLLPEPGCAEKQGNPHPTRYPTAVSLGSGVGFLAGIIGQGGAFIILPLMIHVLKVPLRTAIGTTTAVAFLSALAGFLGKWSTGQVPLLWGIAVATGALIGGQFGGMLSQRLSTVLLQRILLFTVAVSAVLICLQVLK